MKIVVFSYFLEVGPSLIVRWAVRSSDVSTAGLAAARQKIVDDFTRPWHAALLSQIEGGGIGVNMHAASVFVLCEPAAEADGGAGHCSCALDGAGTPG